LCETRVASGPETPVATPFWWHTLLGQDLAYPMMVTARVEET
jgi:hypothetical protein